MLKSAFSGHASRGQALIETAIMLPLFLLGLFGTLWAVRESSLSERVQESVRYGGLVSAPSNTFTSYSLYAMYSFLDGGALPLGTGNCAVDLGTSFTAVRDVFWQPAGATTSTCAAGTSMVTGPAGSQNYMLQNMLIGAAANAPVDGYLSSHVLGAKTTPLSASQNFFRSPDVGTLMSCTAVGSDIKASLEGGSDFTTPTTAATPFPLVPTFTAVFTTPLTCATFGPAPAQPSYTPLPIPPPTQTPSPPPSTPSPSPTPTRSPTPVPTATPVPTPTPVKTPTPVPTATPVKTPTPVPTPTPVKTPTPVPTPTPTPKPTAAPTATPTPAPTLTPTPNPYGTPPGGLTG